MHELVPTDMIIPGLIIIPTSLFCFFLLRFIIKDSKMAALIVTIGLIFFFTYGHLYNTLKGFEIFNEEVGRHRYLLPIFIITYSSIIFYFLKRKFDFKNITKLVNYFSITIILLALIIVDNL